MMSWVEIYLKKNRNGFLTSYIEWVLHHRHLENRFVLTSRLRAVQFDSFHNILAFTMVYSCYSRKYHFYQNNQMHQTIIYSSFIIWVSLILFKWWRHIVLFSSYCTMIKSFLALIFLVVFEHSITDLLIFYHR